MVGTQVKLTILSIDGGKAEEQVEGIPQPVMPDMGNDDDLDQQHKI